jgi:serine/threonine protein kinase/uncharacterized protein HemY
MHPAGERWSRVKEVFEAAMDLDPLERASLLAKECGHDNALRREIESLLESDEQSDGFIEEPAFAIPRDLFSEEPEEAAAGRQFGPYQVVREIGRGGLGAVFLAARSDDEYQKHVAIKLVRRGLDTADILRRFRNERQILAQLDHPNIARLIDGGTTKDGLPYFVLEYVRGEPIAAYCTAGALATTDRLALFRKVCAAVTYAHQNLVVHRDLKPSNILVTPEGEPKLLDFGIAKLLDVDEDSLAHTVAGQRVMTPEYASPEQVRGEKITTASDVYSLGVLLYELLTGERPYRLRTRTPQEISRAITEQEPERPSTAVMRGENSKSNPRNSKLLKGDLDNIVLMAMRKEPPRRYASVAQFSEDIRRHLEGLPVIARKDTATYRTTKFIRRNKIGAAAAALICLTLVAGIVATYSQAKIATAQRDRARRQASKAERVTTFLQNVLGFSDPSWASSNPNRKREATIAEALVEAARRAEKELADEPEALAAVHFTIGNTYRTQSRYTEAEPHLRAALEIRRRVLGSEHLETGESMVAMAEWFILTNRYPEAEPLLREAVTVFRQTGNAKWLSIALNDLGTLKWYTGNAATAEHFLREALVSSNELTGEDRAPRAVMLNTLGLARRDQGDFGEAAQLLEQAIDEYRALTGEPRSELALALGNLATVLFLQGELTRAESLALDAYELSHKTLGENHLYTAYPLGTLAEIYYRQQDYRKARETIEHAMEIQQRALAGEHLDLLRSRVMLGKIVMRTGSLADAEAIFRDTIAKLEAAPGHVGAAGTRGALGECLTLQNRFEEAEPLLLESYHAVEQRLGGKDPRVRDAARRLVVLYEAWHKPEKAAPFQ